MSAHPATSGAAVAVLLIEDNPGDARLVREMLREAAGFRTTLKWVERLKDGLEYLSNEVVDIVLLDLSLPDSQGVETVTRIHEHAENIPIVVLSGLADEATAVSAVHEGAQDYLIKGQFDAQLVARSMRYAIERERVRSEVEGLKGLILSMVSHELRTPITHIKGFASSLLEPDVEWDQATQRDFIQEIDKEADRLAALVSDILEMSKLDSRKGLPIEVAPVDPALLMNDAIRRTAAATAAHTIIREIPSSLPTVPVNADQITRVLINLLENAAKYSDPGTAIKVKVSVAGSDCCFTIEDQGIGIPAELHERIFERFFRAKSTRQHVPGTGLGLAICQSIVNAHRGRIWLESEAGAGTRFVFCVPVEESEIQGREGS